ncbi:MAG: DUF2282 domain-containing protein [Alphaproteobacteria bacterium]|nr:DUF2282 domain-containing protein [Alphaproteobacteria bacterium]
MTKKITINSILAGAVALSALGLAASPAHAIKDDQEKCYGVVKAGQNGCGSADGAHGCAGQATVDGSGVEWIALPSGTCEKLVGGSVEPIQADAHGEDHGDEH